MVHPRALAPQSCSLFIPIWGVHYKRGRTTSRDHNLISVRPQTYTAWCVLHEAKIHMNKQAARSMYLQRNPIYIHSYKVFCPTGTHFVTIRPSIPSTSCIYSIHSSSSPSFITFCLCTPLHPVLHKFFSSL